MMLRDHEALSVLEGTFDFLNVFIDRLAPVFFLINVPLALISGIWILCTGGWRIVLCDVCVCVCAPIVMFIMTAPVGWLGALLSKKIRTIAALLMAIFHWGLASIWACAVLTIGMRWGDALEINTIPMVILCLSTTVLPYSNVLNDAFRCKDHTRVPLSIILTFFIELASITSFIVLFSLSSPLTGDREMGLTVFYTFLVYGVIVVPLYCRVASTMMLIIQNSEAEHL